MPPLGRVQDLPSGILDGNLEPRAEPRHHRLQTVVQRAQARYHPVPRPRGVGEPLDPEVGPEQAPDRVLGGRAREGDTAHLQHVPVPYPLGARQLPQQPRFADAGLAADQHELAVPFTGAGETGLQDCHLGPPPDKRGERPPEIQPATFRPGETVRLPATLGERYQLEATLQERRRRRAHHRLTRRGRPQQPIEHRAFDASRVAVDRRALTSPTDEHERGVHPHLDARPGIPVAVAALDGLVNRQRGMRGAAGSVLDAVEPERRHHARRRHLFDPRAEALDLLHQGLQRGARLRHGPRRAPDARMEQREVSPLPAKPGIGGRDRPLEGARLSTSLRARRDAAEAEFLDVRVYRVARDAEERGRPGNIPSGSFEGSLEMTPDGLVPAEGRQGDSRATGGRESEDDRGQDGRVVPEDGPLEDIEQLADIARPVVLQ